MTSESYSTEQTMQGVNIKDCPELSWELKNGNWVYCGPYEDLTQNAGVHTVLVLLMIAIIVLGVAGNAMVVGVVWTRRSLRTPTNYYIVSLALSDLLVVTVAIPLKLAEYAVGIEYTIFNTVFCTFTGFVMPAVVFTSIWTLVAISIDRYLVIISPLKARSFNTRSRALRIVAVIWTAPLVVLSPYLYPSKLEAYHLEGGMGSISRVICAEGLFYVAPVFNAAYRIFLFGILFVVPVVLLAFSCGSIARRLLSLTEDEKMLKDSVRKEDVSRRKVAKMILVVVFCFFTCWCPYFVVSLISQYTKLLQGKNFIFTLLFIHLCGFANSFMNPVIYALMSQTFRTGFWDILTVCCPQYRGAVKGGGNRTEHRSVTAVSQTEVAEKNRAKKGYTGFFRRESTQLSGVSDPEDDRIAMSRIDQKPGSRFNNNDGKVVNSKVVQDAERKQRAERLLHKFLDEELDILTPHDPAQVAKAMYCVTKTSQSAFPLINTGELEKGYEASEREAVYQTCNHTQNELVNGGQIGGQMRCGEPGNRDGSENQVNQIDSQSVENEVQNNLNELDPSIPPCVAWKKEDLMLREDVPDAHAHDQTCAIPHIAIEHTSTEEVEQLRMDNAHEPAQVNTNGPISNNIIANV